MGNAHPESMCPAPEHTQCRQHMKDEGNCDTQSQEEFFSVHDLDSTTDEEYLDPGTLQTPDSGESIDMGANTSRGPSPSAPIEREKQEATRGPSSKVPSPKCPEKDQATCGIEESSPTRRKPKITTQSHVQVTTGSLGGLAKQKPGSFEKPPHIEGNIVCDERILEEQAGTDEEQAGIHEQRASIDEEQVRVLKKKADTLKEQVSTLEERAGNDKDGHNIYKERVWIHKIQVGFFEKTAGIHEEQASADKVQDGIRKKWDRIRKEWDCIRKTETLKQPPSHRIKKMSSGSSNKPTRESNIFFADLAEEILSKSAKSPATPPQNTPCSKDNRPPEPPLSQDERQAQGRPTEPLGSDTSAHDKKPPHSEVDPASGTSSLQTPAMTQAHAMAPSNAAFIFQSGGVGGLIQPMDEGLRVSHCSNPSLRQCQSVKKKQAFKNSPRKKLQSHARSSSPGSSLGDNERRSPRCPSRMTWQEGEAVEAAIAAGIAFSSSPTVSGAVNTNLPKEERFFKMTAGNGEQIHSELPITMVDKSCQTSQSMSLVQSQSKPSSAKPKKSEKRRKIPEVPSAALQTPWVSPPEERPPSHVTEPSKTPSCPCLDPQSTKEEHGDFKRETHDPLTKHNGEDLDSLRHPVPERLQHPTPKKLKKVRFARTNKPPVSSRVSPVRDEGLPRSSQSILADGFTLLKTSTGNKSPVRAPLDVGTKPSQRLPKSGLLLVEENTLVVNKIARGDPVSSQAMIPKANPPCRKQKASSRTFRHKLGVQQAVENQSITKDRLTLKPPDDDHPAEKGKTSPTEQVHPSITDDTSGGNHEEEPEQEQKPNQRWESFHVDMTCGRKTQRKTNLPPNVTAWRNVSQNWLSEPVWITTMKLASSLVVGTKLCLDHFELQAAERTRETKERRV